MPHPRASITEHASARGSWTLWRQPPHPALRRYILEYQGYIETGGPPLRRRELPSAVVPMIINLGEPFYSHDIDRPERVTRLARCFTAGLHERHALIGSTGNAACLQVDMTPLAARRLFGVPMQQLRARIVELDDLPWAKSLCLTDRLADLADWPARFALLDRVLTARLATAPPLHPAIDMAFGHLVRSDGKASIGGIATGLEVSRQHLNRLFIDAVGLSAKATARLIRFEAAVAALQEGLPLAEVAALSGYFDQPHFNRDCRAFAGESPKALRRRILPDGTGIMDAMP